MKPVGAEDSWVTGHMIEYTVHDERDRFFCFLEDVFNSRKETSKSIDSRLKQHS